MNEKITPTAVKTGKKRLADLAEGVAVQLNLTVKSELRSHLKMLAVMNARTLIEECELALTEHVEKEKIRTGSERSSVWQSVTLPMLVSDAVSRLGNNSILTLSVANEKVGHDLRETGRGGPSTKLAKPILGNPRVA